MMDAFILAKTLICLSVLLLAWHFWKDAMRERLSQKIDSIREEWRDFFIANNLSLDSKVYSEFRDSLIALSDNAKDLRFCGFLHFLWCVSDKRKQSVEREIEKKLSSINIQARDKIEELQKRTAIQILAYFLSTSFGPVFLIVCNVAHLLYKIVRVFSASLAEEVREIILNVIDARERTSSYVSFRSLNYGY